MDDLLFVMRTSRFTLGRDSHRVGRRILPLSAPVGDIDWLTPASINRTVGLLRHMLNWAVGREYLDRIPFRRGTEVLVRMEREDNKRRRRVSEEEEAALLAVASPRLRSMIIAALDTGMRRGEMLALQFGDVDWKQRLIVLRGATTKSRRTRVVPIGASRLLAVLQWLRLDNTSGLKADDMPIFSNEVGEPLKKFKNAWLMAVLKAHGVDPQWRKGADNLTTSCQQRFREINPHWHDLSTSTRPGSSSETCLWPRFAIFWAARRFSRRNATTTRSSKLFRLLSSDWKKARGSTPRMPRTEFLVFSSFSRSALRRQR